MAIDPGLEQLLGLLAGALIVGLGSFVLAARPSAWLHRLFFAFALVDGVSTGAFALRASLTDPFPKLYAMLVYFVAYVLFVAMLLVLALAFPRPLFGPTRTRRAIYIVAAAGGVIALAALADHTWFWHGVVSRGALTYAYTPAGRLPTAAFYLGIVLVAARLVWSLKRDASPTHRAQAGFVLGGLVFGFATQPATFLMRLLVDPASRPVVAEWDRVVVLATLVAVPIVLLGLALTLVPHARHREARFALWSFAGVAVLAGVTLVSPTLGGTARVVALAVYPGLLAYAIVRYNVLEIDARLRQRAALAATALGLTAVFILVEEALENVVADQILSGFSSQGVRSAVAALAAALAAYPLLGLARRGLARVAPTLKDDGLHARAAEIYRHALYGALGDGAIDVTEVRTLAALRDSLGITAAEHDEFVRTWPGGGAAPAT